MNVLDLFSGIGGGIDVTPFPNITHRLPPPQVLGILA